MKKKSQKQLKNLLWKLTSRYVRTKEQRCYTCGKYLDYVDRQAGHYWTQGGHKNTKYDLMNIHTQCMGCNHFKSGNLAEYAHHLINDYGLEEFMRLEQRAKMDVKLNILDYELMVEEMKQKISALQKIS